MFGILKPVKKPTQKLTEFVRVTVWNTALSAVAGESTKIMYFGFMLAETARYLFLNTAQFLQKVCYVCYDFCTSMGLPGAERNFVVCSQMRGAPNVLIIHVARAHSVIDVMK
jgi:hypothetical protein